MILLKKAKHDTGLYNLAYLDSPGLALSTTSLYHNVLEASSILYNFEDAYNRIKVDYENYGYKIDDYKLFEQCCKTFYQSLRHGLSFDWVINYFIGEIVRYFPFCHFDRFKGTDPFITEHRTDAVFMSEIGKMEHAFARMLDKIFVTGDPSVLRRLVNDSEQTEFMACVEWAKTNGKLADYEIVEETLYRTNFLVAIGMMLSDGVGIVKREAWHEALDKIKNGDEQFKDVVLVCGGKFRANAFGDIDGTGVKWHVMENGIRSLGDSTAPVPTHSTYFRISANSVQLDNTVVPEVKIGDGPSLDSIGFATAELHKEAPHVLTIQYPLNAAENAVLEIVPIKGCVIKDQGVMLDASGKGVTQIYVTGDEVHFAVSNSKSPLPYAEFRNMAVTRPQVEWL